MTNPSTETEKERKQDIETLQQELRQLLSSIESKSQNPSGDTTKDALEDIQKAEHFADSLETKLDNLLSRLDTMLRSQEEAGQKKQE
ncbi:hypothetical protein LPJ57_002977 [Coemansia sp. RSA 486]|nr:hypothetical protein LPJ57_002977 [Coemansia sp. RSA 486]KAJ2238408.1 hypothetical protein IWW45_000028 [Coemansia sp. RSA 485]